MNPPSFINYLKKNELPPVCLIYGPELFFHDELLEQISRKIFTNPAEKDFNFEVFYGPESGLNQVVSACMAFPMMAAKKLVVVKQFDKLKLEDADSFLKYVKTPQNSTMLVLISENYPKTKIYTQIRESALSINCRSLKEPAVFTWVQQKFRENSIEIDSHAQSFLIQNTGLDLLRLKIEIEKIINYIKPAGSVSIEQISEITGFSRDFDVFNLQKVLSYRNLKQSLRIGLKLLEQGDKLAAIIPLIYTQFRKIWIVKASQLKQESRQALLSKVKSPAWQWDDAFKAAELYRLQEIKRIFEHLLEAEIQLKTSQKSETSILSLLFFKICSK